MKRLMKTTAIAMAVAAPLVVTQTVVAAQNFIASQSQGEWTASTLIGQPVKNSKNETVGDVNDLVFSENGKLAAVVIGVGGFLGIAEKNVAVPVALVRIEGQSTKDAALRVNLPKAAFLDAPTYQPLKGVGIGTMGKLFQQAKDVGKDVSAAAKKAVEKGKELGEKAAEKATELKDSVVGEKKSQ